MNKDASAQKTNIEIKDKDVENALKNFGFDFLQKIEKGILEYTIRFQDIKTAGFILNKIKPLFDKKKEDLKRENREEYIKWNNIFVLIQFISLHNLSDEDIVRLIEKHYVDIYKIPNYSLYDYFKVKMIWMSYEERDKFKKKVREALERNTQRLTSENIVIDTFEKKGTTSNWILDYKKSLGTDPVSNVLMIEYITNSLNTKDVSKESRQRLKDLFSFYEYLKLSSDTIAGTEDTFSFVDAEDGKLKILNRDGIFEISRKIRERVRQAIDILKGRKENRIKVLDSKTSVSKENYSNILKEYNTLPVSLDKIREKIADLENRKSKYPNILDMILEHKERVKDESYIIAAIALALNIKKDGVNKEFVRDILKNYLKWDENNSAKLGIRLGKIIGEEWGHYNKNMGRFEWK